MTQTPYKQRNRTGENFKKKHKLKEQDDSIHLVSEPDRAEPQRLTEHERPAIAAQFEVLELIGKGGMGAVYKVYDKELDKIFAVKLMQQDLAKDQVAQKRFEQEVEASCQLTHQNLIATYGHGKTADGTPYLVMEYVPGEALSDLLIREGPLEAARALRLWRQICGALEHAHKNGVIHRDLKPTNVIISRANDGTETARLLDFGIAKIISATSRETHNLTETGTVFGSPQYMSPEHCLGFKMDERSDIYSLGCTLYYAVTGKVPFPGGTPKSKARRHLEETPWHPRRFNEEVSDDFVDLIGDMMEKDPKERIQSAEEVAERLAPWAADDSPLLREEMGDRPRWMPAPIGSPDAQDTDPDDAVTEMAMHEISDTSQSSIHGTMSDDNSISGQHNKPPPPLSTVEQYKSAGRIDDAITFSMSALFVTAIVCLSIGILVGFIAGFLMAK